jgi:thymidylate synthase
MDVDQLHNARAFIRAYADCHYGELLPIRGSIVKEKENARIELAGHLSPLTSFAARKLNLNYAKQEFLWYLRADPLDDSIEQHATMWAKIKQPDGRYYSNYGQYLFPDQTRYVVESLLADRFSRRASVILLQPHHLFHENKDTVCTYAINFRVRQGKLNMSVHMRSNDVIFGTTNDVFCFNMYQRFVAALLGLEPGTYCHLVDSLHVYERHFSMVDTLLKGAVQDYRYIDVPMFSGKEARQLADCIGSVGYRNQVFGPVTEWLHATDS